MLEAIRTRLKQALPQAVLAVPNSMSRSARRSLGVLGVLPAAGGGVRTRLSRALPRTLRRATGAVRTEEVEVVLDASGYGYGDFWGESKLRRRLVERLENWSSDCRVAIMLPQALGPFTKGELPELMGRAVGLLDLVWVRDRTSLEHVRGVTRADHVRLAPDYTNLLHPSVPAAAAKFRGSSLIIANEKMVTGNRSDQKPAYINFLRTSAEALQEIGQQPRILIHEGDKDLLIANELNSLLRKPLEIINLASSLDTKAVIGAAHLIISSRFHGLVSALSAGVPSLACGWSHKYDELMRDYGVSEAIISLEKPETWRPILTCFFDSAKDAAYRERLSAHAQKQRSLSEEMWEITVKTIQHRLGVSKT